MRTLVGSSLPHLVYFKFCVNQSCEVRKEEKISCFLLSLNSSTIDEPGDGAWKGMEPQAHDNPVSSKHHQWNHDTYHILTRKGAKSPSTVKETRVHVRMSLPQKPSCGTMHTCMSTTGEAADQHCFAFNLA